MCVVKHTSSDFTNECGERNVIATNRMEGQNYGGKKTDLGLFVFLKGKAGDFGNSVVYSLIFKQNMTVILSI